MKYGHFTIEERERIQELWWERKSIRFIATDLKRAPSSISRELKRNFPPEHKVYTPRLAHARALRYRKHRGRPDRLKNDALRVYVVSHLKHGWSPEQIAATAPSPISHEAIYQFIYARVSSASDLIYAHQEDLRPYLALHRKRRMRKGLQRPHRIEKGPLPSIELRPQEVERRTTIGHWEDDSIVFSPTCPVRLRTTNERVSGIVFIDKAQSGTMAEANRITCLRLGILPKEVLKTLTRDRGSENMGYAVVQEELGIQCFFAHAYASYERGSNENTNGLIRRFFPKGTDFRTITNEEIARVEHLLNSRPRKRLGWKTPYEVFYNLTGVALQS